MEGVIVSGKRASKRSESQGSIFVTVRRGRRTLQVNVNMHVIPSVVEGSMWTPHLLQSRSLPCRGGVFPPVSFGSCRLFFGRQVASPTVIVHFPVGVDVPDDPQRHPEQGRGTRCFLTRENVHGSVASRRKVAPLGDGRSPRDFRIELTLSWRTLPQSASLTAPSRREPLI